MPAVHYRRQLPDPLSNIFGSASTTTTTTPTAAIPTTTAATTPAGIPSDPLGGLSSAIESIISQTSPITPSSVVPPTTPSTTSTIPTTTSFTPTSTIPPTTVSVDVPSTSAPQLDQASTTIPSPSASATDTPTNHSTIALATGGSLVGLFVLGLIVSFFLRRWNRNRSRVQSRESIDFNANFNANEFRRSAAPLQDDRSARFSARFPEQKRPESAFHVPVMSMAGAGGYTEAYTPEHSPYQQPQMYAVSARASLYQPQQQQIYSPHPHHGYPTSAQQVATAYRGEEHMPNPHPVTEDEEAYGAI
ncbi:hypothetical protein B0H12DRAFT_1319236 [Mycena haematopus]|nr:hypothetical protein B0H12DRAFT_1319236 [Mycena haematopus]